MAMSTPERHGPVAASVVGVMEVVRERAAWGQKRVRKKGFQALIDHWSKRNDGEDSTSRRNYAFDAKEKNTVGYQGRGARRG